MQQAKGRASTAFTQWHNRNAQLTVVEEMQLLRSVA
jgi:hypothetical protein